MSKFGGSIIYEFMMRIYLSLMVLVCTMGAMAQQDYYVFIQETSRQPFYVRMGEESHSSSAEGHIILSKLRDSVYNFYIGFPRGRGELLFIITMNKKDHGYELRNVEGKRQLFDLQTQQLISPVATTQSNEQTFRKSDSYSELMAGVVDDSAVLYMSPSDTLSSDTALVKNKADSIAEITAAADTTKVKMDEPVVAVVDTGKGRREIPVNPASDSIENKKEKPVANAMDSNKAKNDTTDIGTVVPVQPESSSRDKRDIIRLSTENLAEGKLMIYVDRTGPVNDTIRIIIPRRL